MNLGGLSHRVGINSLSSTEGLSALSGRGIMHRGSVGGLPQTLINRPTDSPRAECELKQNPCWESQAEAIVF